MSLRSIFQNFAEGFSVKGIFIQANQEIFPIFQEKANALLIIKRQPNLQNGINELRFESTDIGVLVDPLKKGVNIIIIAEMKNIHEIAAHWKRFSPVIKKQINIDEFVLNESIQTRLIIRLEEIRVLFSESIEILMEKIKYDTEP